MIAITEALSEHDALLDRERISRLLLPAFRGSEASGQGLFARLSHVLAYHLATGGMEQRMASGFPPD